jgi:hypothetical protein
LVSSTRKPHALAEAVGLPASAFGGGSAGSAPARRPGQLKCISEEGLYVRITRKVFAYITSAKGSAQGHGTIVLAPKSAGAAAKNSYTMVAKMNGGSSQSARECRVY